MGAFEMGLMAANLGVAVLNLVDWSETQDVKDMLAAIAWFGSAAYWVFRSIVG